MPAAIENRRFFHLGGAALADPVERALAQRSFYSVAQPIVSLRSGRAFGYEALTRPALDPPLDSPAAFLEAARARGRIAEVDSLWRRGAITSLAPQLPAESLLFLNVDPATLIQGGLTAPALLDLVRGSGLCPERVVLELTENERIGDFASLRATLGAFRSHGFLIAIDDAGAGPSSLQAIVELRPHFIKLDRWISRDIHVDQMRRSVVDSIVKMARGTRARVVAEGIEDAAQLETFVALGADLGQGYLFGRPSREIRPPATNEVPALASRPAALDGAAQTTTPVGTLAVPVPVIDPSLPGSELLALFSRNDLLDAVIIARPGAAPAVLTRNRLLLRLAGQYALVLTGRRPCIELASSATVVDGGDGIEAVARLALDRAPAVADDPVVVQEGDRLLGLVGVTDLLREMVREQVSEARHSNPLTGLPGNLSIRRYVEARASAGSGLVLLYADIDHFKQFNDHYGFAAGDHAIELLAKLLAGAAGHCRHEYFLGHIGGDDFVAVLDAADLPRVRQYLERALARRWFDPVHATEASRLGVTIAGAHLEALEADTYEDRARALAVFKSEIKRRGGARFEMYGRTSARSEAAA